MAIITPTITTDDPHEYREQMERIATFSEGVHLDFADGIFAPTILLPLDTAWRNDDLITHAHIMYQDPLEVIDDIISLEADLVILHAEADNLKESLEILQENGTRTGIALLAETSLSEIEELEIDGLFDHVLLFGGSLGHQGGRADLTQLHKVAQIRERYGDIELSWDGGVTLENVSKIAGSGIDVINVGSAIKLADDPKKAYDTLVSLVS